jgi:acyl-CoA synthetase (AMP-forming)/AMP-acid ligase II
VKKMFTRGGFNVYPREVERALEQDPRVAEASVSAVPDAGEGARHRAHRGPRGPRRRAGRGGGEAICRERLAAYKQPGRIVIEA